MPKAMTADDILAHPALERCVRSQAHSLLSIQGTSPRIASLFATQQRWLMAHAALAQYFRNEADDAGAGLLAERFLELVERHGLASRNTASDFLAEMLKYEMVRLGADRVGATGRSSPRRRCSWPCYTGTRCILERSMGWTAAAG